jgi:hypothetical protein
MLFSSLRSLGRRLWHWEPGDTPAENVGAGSGHRASFSICRAGDSDSIRVPSLEWVGVQGLLRWTFLNSGRLPLISRVRIPRRSVGTLKCCAAHVPVQGPTLSIIVSNPL